MNNGIFLVWKMCKSGVEMNSCDKWEFDHVWVPVGPALEEQRKLKGKGPWKDVPVEQRDGMYELRCSSCGECKVGKRPKASTTY
jgi:hypothetical protein